MSLDPFEARLQFLKLLRTLNASQQSIQKVVSFAVKYGARCGEDLWECVVDEVAKGSLNARINLLYLLDSLAETSATVGPPDAPYLPLIERTLPALVASVVPPTRAGILNVKSTRAILDSWRTRRMIDPAVVDEALSLLAETERKARALSENSNHISDVPAGSGAGGSGIATAAGTSASAATGTEAMSRQDILRRIEEDRERQKRLRERIWILPIPPLRNAPSTAGTNPRPSPASPFTPASPREVAASASASGSGGVGGAGAAGATGISRLGADGPGKHKLMPPPPLPSQVTPAALDIEFDQLWDSAGGLDEDDYEAMRENARAANLTQHVSVR